MLLSCLTRKLARETSDYKQPYLDFIALGKYNPCQGLTCPISETTVSLPFVAQHARVFHIGLASAVCLSKSTESSKDVSVL